jgi:hypothetical protein
MFGFRRNQFAPAQMRESGLDGALRKSRGIGKGAQTRRHRLPLAARRLSVKV